MELIAENSGANVKSSMLHSVAARTLALAILPVVVLATLTMVNLERSFSLFESGVEAREEKTQRVEAMAEATHVFRDDLIRLLGNISATVQSHNRSIMSENSDATSQTLALRAQIEPTVDSLRRNIQDYRAELEIAGLADGSSALSEEGLKHLAIVTRLANSLPHLFRVYRESNDRTIVLVQEQNFAAATANFVFEESARLRAFNQSAIRLNTNLDALSEIVDDIVQEENRKSIDRTFAELNDMSTDTLAFLFVFVVVLISAATWFSIRCLARPLQAIAQATNALSDGDIDVEIPDGGRGEIGDIARSLHVFKEASATAIRAKTGLDHVAASVTITDHSGTIIYANRAACELFSGQGAVICNRVRDFSGAGLVGSDTQDILDSAGVADLAPQHLTGHESREFGKNGRVFTVAADPVRGRSGSHLGSVLLWDDITERRRDEEKLREYNVDLERQVTERTASLTELNRTLENEIAERTQANEILSDTQEHLGAILHNMIDGIITIDEGGEILSANPAVEEIFGYTQLEIVGRNVSLLMPEPDHSRHDGYLEAYRRTGEAKILGYGPQEVMAKRKDGSVFPMDLAISDMQFGERLQFIAVVRDVTDRSLAEAALAARAVQQSAVVELGRVALESDDLSVLFEQAGALVAKTLNVGYAAIFEPDPECADLLLWAGGGWRSGLLGNASVTRGLETPTGYCFTTGEHTVIEDAALEKRFTDVEFFNVHNLVSGTSVAIQGHNETYGVLAAYANEFRPIVGEDIQFLMTVANVLSVAIERHRAKTAHEELTEQFHQAQKMDAIGQLAGGVAHDFNNILMTIDGYTRIAQSCSDLTADTEDALKRVLVATDKASGLTNQLLVFSRKQSVDARVVEPNSILPGLDTLLRPLLGESVRLDVAPLSEQTFVETDVAQFTQALVNLAINARDAMPGGGRISVSLHLIEADAEFLAKNSELPPGSYLRIDVEDDGEGIDEKTMESIFEPFFTTKEAGKGTGLGLAMVCGFVDQSKGAIEVESTVGNGTTFSIYLPTTDEQAEEIPDLDEEVYGSKGETILLAEDDKALCDLIRRTLESLGYTVLSANDGFEALEQETEYEDRIDLVLTDVVMPSLGGVELAEAIRKTRPDMAVLYMSGYPSRGMAKQIDLPDGVALVSKPCPPARLARAVREVLDGSAVN